jgi:hypothetical protein
MAKTAGVVSLGDVPYSLSADIASKLEQRSAPTQLEKKKVLGCFELVTTNFRTRNDGCDGR